jgi:hypothetical protein
LPLEFKRGRYPHDFVSVSDHLGSISEDGWFEIVWKTAPITGEVEGEIATAATEGGHYSTNPRLSISGDPGYAAPKAETNETASI